MSEKDLGMESLVKKATPESPENREGGGFLDENTRMQNELTAFRNELERGLVEPITFDYLKRVVRHEDIIK